MVDTTEDTQGYQDVSERFGVYRRRLIQGHWVVKGAL